jgi:hypothetical protein
MDGRDTPGHDEKKGPVASDRRSATVSWSEEGDPMSIQPHGYLRQVLADDEDVLLIARPHWFVLLSKTILWIALFVAVIAWAIWLRVVVSPYWAWVLPLAVIPLGFWIW